MIGLLSLIGCAGERPTTLGASDGQLGTCPDSPNCISSFEARESHQVAPLQASLDQLRQVLTTLPEAAIITDQPPYLYAEFTSRLMGYVDDVEFLEDPASGLVHVRSASRLGQSDLGANRKRIEGIRATLAAGQ
ncbi:MAG: DUF1499 domain-containing protein [Gammaproteobacteria bacterium]